MVSSDVSGGSVWLAAREGVAASTRGQVLPGGISEGLGFGREGTIVFCFSAKALRIWVRIK